jgi:hypothetical protein
MTCKIYNGPKYWTLESDLDRLHINNLCNALASAGKTWEMQNTEDRECNFHKGIFCPWGKDGDCGICPKNSQKFYQGKR